MDIEATSPPAALDARAARRIYRHRLPVRLMHWINVVCLTILLMSGLQIFNAHPALYWGRVDVPSRGSSFGAAQPSGPFGYTSSSARVRHDRVLASTSPEIARRWRGRSRGGRRSRAGVARYARHWILFSGSSHHGILYLL